MKIKYLGTAAAEGVPAIFCHCETCRKARARKGKEIRTRTQAMIDNKLLLDLGPDTFFHLLKYDMDITELEHCLITHVHSDHFLPEQLLFRNPGYGVLKEGTKPLNIYGSKDVSESLLDKRGAEITGSGNVIIREAVPYRPMQLGDYKVTSFPAVHGSPNPLFYAIENAGRTILYAHDTDFFSEKVWEFMLQNQMRFDLVSMDCTEGFREVDYVGHMNFEKNLILMQQMLQLRLADEKTLFVANHFSHNGHANYAEAVEFAQKHSLIVAYDGLELEV